jgi:hypothetical protein
MYTYYSDDEEETPPPVCEHWQYTQQDWVGENNDQLLKLYEDIQHGIKSTGANILTDCSFADFCHLVCMMSWVPEIGQHVVKI